MTSAFLEAVKLERKIQPLRYLERDIESKQTMICAWFSSKIVFSKAILVAAKDSQEDNSVARIEEGIAHATLNKRNLEKLEVSAVSFLECYPMTDIIISEWQTNSFRNPFENPYEISGNSFSDR